MKQSNIEMEQFNIEMGNLRCKLRDHQVEWVSHLSKVLSVEKISLEPRAWNCFFSFPLGKSTNEVSSRRKFRSQTSDNMER